MRADQMVALRAGGDTFAVISDDPAVLDAVRGDFSEWIEAGISFPGFEVKRPGNSQELWTLINANGAIVARARHRDPVLRSLLRHLDALISPQSENAIRLRLQAVLGPRGLVLVDPAIVATEPIVERRWDRSGLALVDSPFIDVELDGSRALTTKLVERLARATDPGHASASSLGLPVSTVLWRSTLTANRPTSGQIVHALAASCLTGSLQQRLHHAVELSRRVGVELVAMGGGQPSALSRFEALVGGQAI